MILWHKRLRFSVHRASWAWFLQLLREGDIVVHTWFAHLLEELCQFIDCQLQVQGYIWCVEWSLIVALAALDEPQATYWANRVTGDEKVIEQIIFHDKLDPFVVGLSNLIPPALYTPSQSTLRRERRLLLLIDPCHVGLGKRLWLGQKSLYASRFVFQLTVWKTFEKIYDPNDKLILSLYKNLDLRFGDRSNSIVLFNQNCWIAVCAFNRSLCQNDVQSVTVELQK